MFQNILVALDDSEISRKAFEKAVSLAKSLNAKLMLTHVLSPSTETYPELPMMTAIDGYYQDLYGDKQRIESWQAFEKTGLELLQTLSQKAKEEGIQVEFTQVAGNPGRKICDVAWSWQADLVVMGSRGRTGLQELFLGSVSNYVSHHVPCSILIVHDQNQSEMSLKEKEKETVASS